MQNKYKSAEVLYNNKRAGIIKRTDSGYEFIYDLDYLGDNSSRPVSLSMPLSQEIYRSRELFPFFEGLLPEGWLLSQTSSVLKIDVNDKFNLLLNIGRDTIGAVSIIPLDLN
ncbi:MAG: HipA N-terminal domain-containing protein [Actinobacteria bacterium]|jgi:serine/threonine-protein kinase HipA|nr:HipA N-terminal domain-containing protein [Actinomycetota bacterium]